MKKKGKTHLISLSVLHHQTMQLKRGLSLAPIASEELTLSSSIQCSIVAPDDQHFATEVDGLCVVTHLEFWTEMDGRARCTGTCELLPALQISPWGHGSGI